VSCAQETTRTTTDTVWPSISSGYTASARNLANISYATDNVFSDGVSLQTGTVTGSLTEGYTVALAVGVSL
jgi:hypothetical protein